MATAIRAVVPTLGVALVSATVLFAPDVLAAAGMQIGNYEVPNDRWNDQSWVWNITPAGVGSSSADVSVTAISRPKKSQSFQGSAFYVNGRFTLTVDVPDGVRCIGYNLPSHDVYSWDAATLAGTIDSSYSASCYGGPGGNSTYTFALQRM